MNAPDFKLKLKPGHTSTEFWLIIVTGLLTTALSAISVMDVAWGAGAIVVLTLAYNQSRTKLKVIQAETEGDVIRANADAQIGKVTPTADTTPTPSASDAAKILPLLALFACLLMSSCSSQPLAETGGTVQTVRDWPWN